MKKHAQAEIWITMRCFFGSLSCFAIFLVFFAGACISKEHSHIVVDAGSSGTRFCRFSIERRAGRCRSLDSVCYKVERPLAAADSAAIQEIFSSGFGKLQKEKGKGPFGFLGNGAGELEVGKEANGKQERIWILGTGGFRRLPPMEQDRQLKRIRAVLDRRGIAYSLRILTGKEEGVLAYRSVQDLHPGVSFETLEAGGATVQLAYRKADGKAEALSVPLGINVVFGQVRKEKNFRFCYPKTDKAPSGDFHKCLSLLKKFFYKEKYLQSMRRRRLSRLQGPKGSPILHSQELQDGSREGGERVYGLGASWKALLDYVGKDTVFLSELKEAGRRICKKSPVEISEIAVGKLRVAKERGIAEDSGHSIDSFAKENAKKIPLKYARRACYLLSYGTGLMEALEIGRVERGEGSWPHGVALSAGYFPDCR